ncbi:hypothetical protein [Methyloversatilis discipulorum]|uniref:hypothetical protein n=1 Tax=Methyloversatilis discipulorum TaxID=1119528 RepID=UPI00037F5C66|nr:hypothetical protein [Methyloversatilis discipulorum]MBL8468702.1 hypothetical protein [Methyloversatilis discipulorum]
MNSQRAATAALALGLLATSNAWADRGHHHGHRHGRSHVDIGIGFVFGSGHYRPWYGPSPFYYPPPYYYGPAYYPPVVIERAPPVYVERDPQPVAPAPSMSPPPPPPSTWYYCASADGYYPYVTACPEGWQSVAAQPPR